MSNPFNTHSVGDYVIYKDTVVLVVAIKLGRVQLLNPLKGNAKVLVKFENVTKTNLRPMRLIAYTDGLYLVSRLGTIISTTTGRIMKWSQDNKHHLDIMEAFTNVSKLHTTC